MLDQHFFEGLPVGILVCDHSGYIRECNTVVRNIFGYNKDELRGQPLSLLIPESIQKVHERMVESYFQKPESKLMERGRVLRGRHKLGHDLHLNIGLSFRRKGGDVEAIASISNVTERIEAERKVERNRNLLGEIRQLMLDHLKDPDSDEIYYRMLSTFLSALGLSQTHAWAQLHICHKSGLVSER